jgi:hypothetical protein
MRNATSGSHFTAARHSKPITVFAPAERITSGEIQIPARRRGAGEW